MQANSKVEALRKIPQEANLREILMNLLERMGLDPVLTHGSVEHGKDIVCTEEDSVLKCPEWVAVVVKLGRVTGSTSGHGSLQTVINQVQEAFIHPFHDLKQGRKVPINKVWVVTNDVILETAREKITEKLIALGTIARTFILSMESN